MSTPRLILPSGQSLLVLSTSEAARGGIAAVVQTYRSGGLFDDVPTTTVATHVDGSHWAKARQFGLAVAQTFGLLAARRVAVVHAHVSSSASFWRKSLLLALCRMFGVPTIFHLHSGKFDEWVGERDGSLRQWWVRRTLEKSDAVIVLTSSKARWMATFSPKAKVQVIGNPIVIPAAPPQWDRPASARTGRVLYLGWIHDVKGCFDLLKAWAQFRQSCPGWRLVVGGKGDVDRFLAEADALGIRGDLDFLGWVAGDDKERALREADIFVLPSYNEGMPVSVLEAMSYGVSVLTTPVGGVPDMMVQDLHGLWMTPGDIEGMRDRLIRLAQGPELRARLATEAYHHVVRHNSVAAIIEPLLQIYSRLTGAPLHPSRPARP